MEQDRIEAVTLETWKRRAMELASMPRQDVDVNYLTAWVMDLSAVVAGLSCECQRLREELETLQRE